MLQIIIITYMLFYLQTDELWDWDRLFTEVTSDLLNDSEALNDEKEGLNATAIRS